MSLITSVLSILVLLALIHTSHAWESKQEQFANIGMQLKANNGNAEPNAGRCLDIAWGTPDGTYAKAQLWGCKGFKDGDYSNQFLWRYGNNQHQVVGIWHPWHGGVNYCLDVEGGRAFQGANVRWWKCNGADAQKWIHDGRTGEWRPWNNRNLCLDAKEGWNGDRNGQELQLWPCTGDAPQRFGVAVFGHYHSNVVADVERSCAKQSSRDWTCRYSCRKEASMIKVLFEGMKLGCGYFWNPAAALACITGLAVAEQAPPEEESSCGCWCWDPRTGGVGGRRPTVPPHSIGVAPAANARSGFGVTGLIDVFMPNGTSTTMTLADAAAQYPSVFKRIKEFGRNSTVTAPGGISDH